MNSNDRFQDAPGFHAWIILGMLSFVYALNFLSPRLLSILAKPIQDNLHVSDGKLGLNGGLHFALLYCYLDFSQLDGRKDELLDGPGGGVCDLEGGHNVLRIEASYPQFVAAYMAVGFEEAGRVPPAYSIICDCLPASRRGTVLGLFNLTGGVTVQ